MMFALLPLRGWAGVAMTLPVGAAMAPVEVSTVVEAARPACHEQADTADAPAAEPSCLLCQLCHGAVAGLPAAPAGPQSLPMQSPLIETAHDTGRRLTGGLDRPPRI